jgi:uncharacterized damage-inducible protein DinB
MNRRIYAAAGRLPPARRVEDRGAFFGSVQGTLSHLLWADRMWLHRFDGVEKPAGGLDASPGAFPDWPSLQAGRLATDAAITHWAARVDPGWLGTTLAWYSGALGREVSRPMAMLVTHFFNHQTHHRGQVHALLTGLGEQTGDTDLAFILPAWQ